MSERPDVRPHGHALRGWRLMATLTTDDLPPPITGCSHRHAMREAVVVAVLAWWTPARINSLKSAIATAAGTTAANVSNKMAMRALLACIEERQGGTD